MSDIYITQIMGDRRGSVNEDDRQRAIEAAEAVCAAASVQPEAAAAEYRRQWAEFDDEEPMTGAARVWVEARQAADVALTSTWADPGAEACCIIAA